MEFILKGLKILLLVLLQVSVLSCSDSTRDPRLVEIEDMVSYSPREALQRLDSIDVTTLSEGDGHYLDFLTIKARDKAFVRHESDSLILEVIDYAKSHHNLGWYTEALYYGGRVYSDMGDYPAALVYFQNALDEMSDEPDDINLKSRTLSQTSDILISLRLLKDAKQYSEQALKYDIKLNDSMSILYDYEQLGTIDLQSKQYETAEKYYTKALHVAQSLGINDSISFNIPLASIYYYKGNIDSALSMIRPVIRDIDSASGNTALACASLIYREKNIKDSALLYAKKLISGNDFLNRKTGYRVLLSDEILPLLSKDTAIEYVKNYREEIETYLNKNGNQSALMQNSFYNYQTHLRDKVKAEKTSARQRHRILILIFTVVALLLILLCLFIINRYRTNKLRMALFTLTQLRLEISNNTHCELSEKVHQVSTKTNVGQRLLCNYKQKPDNNFHETGSIKSQIRAELKVLLDRTPLAAEVPSCIIESEVYTKLCREITDKNIIRENDATWHELENIISECYPMFKMRLNNLGGHKLNKTELHILFMVKIGIAPTDMSVLLGRSKSTVSFSRHSISKKIFGEEMEIEKIDRLIRIM